MMVVDTRNVSGKIVWVILQYRLPFWNQYLRLLVGWFNWYILRPSLQGRTERKVHTLFSFLTWKGIISMTHTSSLIVPGWCTGCLNDITTALRSLQRTETRWKSTRPQCFRPKRGPFAECPSTARWFSTLVNGKIKLPFNI